MGKQYKTDDYDNAQVIFDDTPNFNFQTGFE